MENKIIGSLNSGHSFYKASKIKSMFFLFCNFEACSIVKLEAEEIVFVGCHFNGGHIVDSVAKNVKFIACSNTEEPIDIALSEFKNIMFESSSISIFRNLEKDIVSSIYHSKLELQQIAEILEDKEDIPQEIIQSVIETLYNTTDLSLFLFYGISIMQSHEPIRLQFLKVFLDKLPKLPNEYQIWFKDFLEYLIEDGCSFPNYENEIATFIQSLK